MLDTLKINSASHITLPHPVIRNQMVVKTLYKLDDAELNTSQIPSNIDVLNYKNYSGTKPIHVSEQHTNLLEDCSIIDNVSTWDESIKKIQLKGIKKLDKEAFKNSKIEEIKIGSTLEEIDPFTFSSSDVKHIEFTEDLANCNEVFTLPSNITVTIPNNSYSRFRQLFRSPIFEKDSKTRLCIEMQKGESVTDILSKDSLYKIDTLCITGTVYINGLKALKSADNLRVLNLKECKILKSPIAVKIRKREMALNFVKELWLEMLNNVYYIRDKQAEDRMAYALVGYMAGKVKESNKEDYENGDLIAGIEYYISK